MISSEELARLADLESPEHPVLSLYLNVGPAELLDEAYRLALRDMLHSLEEEQGDEGLLKAFHQERKRIETFMDNEFKPHGKGLVILSCLPLGLWSVNQLPMPVGTLARFEPRPYVKPLARMLDDYERYAVALVDKENARFVSVFMGGVEEELDLRDFVLGKHKQGGWSQSSYQRHHEAQVFRHLKNAIAALQAFEGKHHFDRLILAGPDEPLAEFRQMLPENLAGKVCATVSLPAFATSDEILRETLAVEEQIERASEERLVEELDNAIGQGRPAALGLPQTLSALEEGRVRTLVVAQGFRVTGFVCRQCHHLLTEQADGCPRCGGRLEAVDDVVEEAVRLAIDTDAEVETISGSPEEHLASEGSIGALLRY